VWGKMDISRNLKGKRFFHWVAQEHGLFLDWRAWGKEFRRRRGPKLGGDRRKIGSGRHVLANGRGRIRNQQTGLEGS